MKELFEMQVTSDERQAMIPFGVAFGAAITSAIFGIAFVALFGWLTSPSFAVFTFGVLMVAHAAQQATQEGMDPGHLPYGWSGPKGQLILMIIGLLSMAMPLVVGAVWFRWWWGFVGIVLAGTGVTCTTPAVHVVADPFGVGFSARLLSGVLLSLVGLVWSFA